MKIYDLGFDVNGLSLTSFRWDWTLERLDGLFAGERRTRMPLDQRKRTWTT